MQKRGRDLIIRVIPAFACRTKYKNRQDSRSLRHGLNLGLSVYEANYSLIGTFDVSHLEYTIVTKYNTADVNDATRFQ